MKYTPLKHQEYGTTRIIEDSEVGAFLDMGLGKTVMTLTAMIELFKSKKIRKVLVIAPKKVAENVWTDEIAKWDHLRHLKTSQVLGTVKQRKKALMTSADIYIINRENVVWLVTEFGSNWPFDFLVIDELSSFKSHDSQRFKALRLVRKYVSRLVGLTGTPAPNGLLDLWSQMFLIDGGKSLGASYNKYRSKYFESDKSNGIVTFSYKLKKGGFLLGDDFFKQEIYDSIGAACFSMRTEDYISLPDCLVNDQYITLSDADQAKYDSFEKEQVLKLLETDKEITAVNAAVLTNKLLQFANGTIYDEDRKQHVVHDGKLEKFTEIIEELNGKPVLVFYSFISDKERLLFNFKQARQLKDSKDIAEWNAGRIPILVAHPLSAGHGLNLQFGGVNVLWYGCPWSLEQYLQGIKRVHRNGVSGVVTNTRLIVKGTVDEEVIKSLESKNRTQDAILEAVRARILKYSMLH